jgi:hypothetical protein
MSIDNFCEHCTHVHHLPRTAQEIDDDGKTQPVHRVACGKCRGGPLLRHTPLKRTQWVRRPTRQQTGWAKAVKQVVRRSGNRCEARTPLCIGQGQQTHHRLKRGVRAARQTRPSSSHLQPVRPLHRGEPGIAYKRGWLIRGRGRHRASARSDRPLDVAHREFGEPSAGLRT